MIRDDDVRTRLTLSPNLGVDTKSKPLWTTRSLVQNVSDAKSNSWFDEKVLPEYQMCCVLCRNCIFHSLSCL